MTYVCPIHQTTNDSWCLGCVTYAELHPVSAMTTPEERAADAQVWIDIVKLTIPFSTLHGRFEALVGRPVWTHELAKPRLLVEEILSGQRASFADVLDKIPSDKQVIVVTPKDEEIDERDEWESLDADLRSQSGAYEWGDSD